jgi:hypothetical protein
MLYRTSAVFIVLFWLAMTALLVHQELRPGDSTLRELPPAHVVKLLFMHHERSTLNIYSDKLRLGQFIVDPAVSDDGQSRNLKFRGDLQVLVPGAGKRQRIYWDGALEMDKLLTIKRFKMSLVTHMPTELTSEVVIVPSENVAHYQLRTAGGAVERQDYTLDERGARSALEQVGIDPSMLPIAKKQSLASAMEIKARQTTLTVPGGQMDTYQITVEANGQTLLECQVDQLGRIVQANTLIGYSLSPEATTP